MCGKLWILSGVAVGITLAACGSETISAIAPVSESGDRVSTIYFDDTDRVQLRDVALALAAANVPEGDRETLAAAAIALLGANPNISTDLIFPDPLIADFDFAEPEGAIDLSDVATIQAALAIAPQNRTVSALATTANRLFAPTAPLTASRIRVIPGEGIPVPSSQPSTLPIPNATDLNTLLTRLECNDCQLQGANLSATEIAIDLEGAVLRQSDLSFANLTRATLVGGDLTLAIAREVTAVETDFREATLLSVDFRDSALRGATFADSGLRGAILSSVDLRAADFSEADLTDTDLSDANLSDAIFNRATFERTQLDRAILVRADFSGVSLATTDFTAADLRGADFRTANLQDAILTDARFDDTTQFPTGFDPERAGLSRQP